MKKILLLAIFLLLVWGAVFAYTCTTEDRDKYYNDCLVRRQCGEKALCKSECMNEANKWYQNGCRSK